MALQKYRVDKKGMSDPNGAIPWYTAIEARAIVLLAVENAGREEILGKIVEWNNTSDNDIDADGHVWVANPQTGHWLNDDRLIELAVFLSQPITVTATA
jgi:hypothetical protein